MIEIGLIGVSGSGKTQLANDIADAYEAPNFVGIVDGYVDAVERRSGIALGQYANYMGNMMIAFERLALEEGVRLEEPPQAEVMVTCGTLIESSAYTAYGINEGEPTMVDMAKVQGALGMLGCLMIDSFRYDLLFYLEPTEFDDFSRTIDREITKVLEAVSFSPVILDQGVSRWARLDEVMSRVKGVKVDV